MTAMINFITWTITLSIRFYAIRDYEMFTFCISTTTNELLRVLCPVPAEVQTLFLSLLYIALFARCTPLLLCRHLRMSALLGVFMHLLSPPFAFIVKLLLLLFPDVWPGTAASEGFEVCPNFNLCYSTPHHRPLEPPIPLTPLSYPLPRQLMVLKVAETPHTLYHGVVP